MSKDIDLDKEDYYTESDSKAEEEFKGKDDFKKRQEIFDEHFKKGKDIAEKVANDFGKTVDDIVLNLKTIQKDVDSKINEYREETKISRIDVDLLDVDNIYYLKADLPGVEKETIDVEIADKDVIIKAYFTGLCDDIGGELHEKEHDFLIKGRKFGPAKRSIRLPQKIKIEEVKGKLENGVLLLTLPQVESKKVKIDLD
ncbi:MAG: Hsp20/alpha crystallin family protein [Methanobrevibacter sp.]|jgi:HSP20 family protein|nr:Hsp20/alpha crystallin family protein [Methanobrevibacter sp.]